MITSIYTLIEFLFKRASSKNFQYRFLGVNAISMMPRSYLRQSFIALLSHFLCLYLPFLCLYPTFLISFSLSTYITFSFFLFTFFVFLTFPTPPIPIVFVLFYKHFLSKTKQYCTFLMLFMYYFFQFLMEQGMDALTRYLTVCRGGDGGRRVQPVPCVLQRRGGGAERLVRHLRPQEQQHGHLS